MAFLPLAALAGTAQGGSGGGLPGFDNSSSAESSAGPITVGGLTFAPKTDTTTVMAIVVVAVAFVVVRLMKA